MDGMHARRRRAALTGAALVGVAALAIGFLTAHRPHGTRAAGHVTSITPASSASTSPSTAPSRPPTPAVPTTRPPARAVRPAVTVDHAVGQLATQRPAGGVSVAALNTRTGARYSWGADGGMWTGSVVKLLILETVLLQHQDQGVQLDDDDLALATTMIENSDNQAEYQLFLEGGGNPALVDAAKRLGLTHTVPGVSDPALTTMSGADGVTLVRNLVRNGPLDDYSRSLTLGLMRNVEADQRWGVSVVADPGTTPAVKDGWLSVNDSNGPGENDGGRWLAASVGVVTVHAQQVLMAVFTEHGPDFADGVQLVESLARAITPAVVAP